MPLPASTSTWWPSTTHEPLGSGGLEQPRIADGLGERFEHGGVIRRRQVDDREIQAFGAEGNAVLDHLAVVAILAEAAKKAMLNEEFKRKMKDEGLTIRYMDPQKMEAYWTDMEERVKPFIEEAKKK